MGAGRLSRVLRRTFDVRGRVAGAGRGDAFRARPRAFAFLRRGSAARPSGGAKPGWRGLAFASALLFVATAEAQVLSSRIWPARDYTRLTLESKSQIKHSIFSVKD